MHIPVEELTPKDYKILNYIDKFDSVHKTQILNHFSKTIKSIELRLKLLATPQSYKTPTGPRPLNDTSYIAEEFDTFIDKKNNQTQKTSTDKYQVTSLGHKVLEDWRDSKKGKWLEHFSKTWVQVAVALIALAALAVSILK